MQKELDADYPELDIQLLGVNQEGYAGGNGSMTLGRDIPWLQDVDGASDVWTSWNVTFRDVVILDAENTKEGTFNVTSYNLQLLEDYTALRQMLVEAASDPAGIPTLSRWGTLALALLMLTGLTITLRRRRLMTG